jgi:hypothetical protein
MKTQRHYCTKCERKISETKMKNVWYSLLQKSAWHCINCMSTSVDTLHILKTQKEQNLLELFSGSKTVATIAESLNYQTFTIDSEAKYNPSLVKDISKLSLKDIPGRKSISIIWASIPCTVYSILNLSNHWEKIVYSHRKYYYIPKTKEAKKAAQLLEKTLWLINSINPDYYFIENPRGALRHMPQIRIVPVRHEISYSDYGLDIYKPTDIFTNCQFLKLKKLSSSVGNLFPGSVTKMSNAYERSKVPSQLIETILKQIQNHENHNK